MFQKISKFQKFPAIQLLWNGQVKYFYKFVMPKLVCYSVAMDWPSQFKFKNIYPGILDYFIWCKK